MAVESLAQLVCLRCEVESQLLDGLINCIRLLDYLMGHEGIFEFVDLLLQLQSNNVLKGLLLLQQRRLKLVFALLQLRNRLALLLHLAMHLLGIFLVLLDALNDLIFKNLHAALKFAHAFWDRVVLLLCAERSVIHEQELGLQVLFHLIELWVLAAASRLDAGCAACWLAVKLLLQRSLVHTACALIGGFVGLVLLHEQVAVRGRCHAVGSQHVFGA